MMPMGGCHRMVVNQDIRKGAGVKAGDTVQVVMERDEAPRTVKAPDLLRRQLSKDKVAQANWDKLAFTHKKEMARSIDQLVTTFRSLAVHLGIASEPYQKGGKSAGRSEIPGFA